ncbi:hypothetical protein [Cerasicoccus fimbriatus]|uniref:hypothetical protein n=1 Tax=Cerasicoccus fimbriatus TaxID=3014554 RepID=UPI0022B312E1|nr:hypothetical protein [Cerasicoccus sp. TK19100]
MRGDGILKAILELRTSAPPTIQKNLEYIAENKGIRCVFMANPETGEYLCPETWERASLWFSQGKLRSDALFWEEDDEFFYSYGKMSHLIEYGELVYPKDWQTPKDPSHPRFAQLSQDICSTDSQLPGKSLSQVTEPTGNEATKRLMLLFVFIAVGLLVALLLSKSAEEPQRTLVAANVPSKQQDVHEAPPETLPPKLKASKHSLDDFRYITVLEYLAANRSQQDRLLLQFKVDIEAVGLGSNDEQFYRDLLAELGTESHSEQALKVCGLGAAIRLTGEPTVSDALLSPKMIMYWPLIDRL